MRQPLLEMRTVSLTTIKYHVETSAMTSKNIGKQWERLNRFYVSRRDVCAIPCQRLSRIIPVKSLMKIIARKMNEKVFKNMVKTK